MPTKTVVLIAIVVLLVAGGFFVITTREEALPSPISNFEDCAAAGYPVMESYPRQCKVPDGETFIEDITVGTGDFEPDISCQANEDCILINKDLEYGCCWLGACQAVDYSQDKWIAANRAWFIEGQTTSCPSTQECGPSPLCNVRAVNLDFSAQCIDKICQKTPN